MGTPEKEAQLTKEFLDDAFASYRDAVIEECIAVIGLTAYPLPSIQRAFADELVAELRDLKSKEGG